MYDDIAKWCFLRASRKSVVGRKGNQSFMLYDYHLVCGIALYSYIATPVYPLIIIRKQAYTHQYIAIYIHREESGRPTARHECAEQKLAGNCFLNYVCGFL